MIKKLTCLAVGIAVILLPACSEQEKKTVPSGTPEVKSFSTAKISVNIPEDKSDKFQEFDSSQLPQGAVPITKAPDGRTIYYMERTDKTEKSDDKTSVIRALKGDTYQKVNLVKFNISTGKKDTVARGIPFISYAKWNKAGNLIAFCGGQRLTVYDSTKNKLLLADELENDSVTYFGWSPDGNSIYTEHENIINGSIYDFKNGKVFHCYQTDIRLYYKGNYGDNGYFASEALDIDEAEQKKSGGIIDENRTVLIDSTGKVLKELPCGRFRDTYNNAVIQIGESGFGLQYYEDMNRRISKRLPKNMYMT
jgi:outer membrane lipopolysaccharide assembly protein LptE/RlpB